MGDTHCPYYAFFGLCAVLTIAHKSQANLSEARHTMLKHKKEIGKISRRELLTLILLIFTIVLWIGGLNLQLRKINLSSISNTIF